MGGTIYYDVSRLMGRANRPFPSGIDRVDLRYALWTRSIATHWVAVMQRPKGLDCLPDNLASALLDSLEQRWMKQSSSAQKAALVCPPSWKNESAEAMAAGLPVIASDIPICREVSQELADYRPPEVLADWTQAVLDYARHDCPERQAQLERLKSFQPITWEKHFALLQDNGLA